MYALSFSAEGDCYRCVPPDPGIAAAALGASASGTPPGSVPAEALHTFTLDSGASRCFFRDSNALTPLPAPVPVRVADPSGGPGRCPFLHCPPVSGSSVRLTVRSSPPLVLYELGSSLYTLATEPPRVAASSQVFASGQVAASCSCRLLTHQTLLWHHRLGHPFLPRLRGMHSRLLVSGLPRSLPPLPPSPAPPCLSCVEGRQRAAPHSSSFSADPPHALVGPSPLRLPLREQFGQVLPVLRQHSDRGGEFSSDFLRDFCRWEGITHSISLPDSPQQNGIAERRIGLVMEPRVSLPQTSPTLRWTGKVGDASVFRVWGSRAFVRDTSADKLSARAIPCVFLGFVPDAPGWQFYHPTSRRVLPSQDVAFDESVPFYRSCSLGSVSGRPSPW
ncbi:unnamed protein product [Closterium sp. NIES-53]